MHQKAFLSQFFCLALSLLAASPKPGDPDFFPLTSWGHNIWLSVPLTQKYFDDMAECGITIAGFANSLEELDMMEKAGLRGWIIPEHSYEDFWNNEVHEEKLHAAVAADVAAYSHHPALYGYFLQDEPIANRFPKLKCLSDEFHRLDPAHKTYINLLPITVSGTRLLTKDWFDYVQQYVDAIHPDHIGYDYYGLPEEPNAIRPQFWKQLDGIRRISQANGLPFQTTLLTVGHLHYRIPTETDIFFQVYSALLYGAKGILYFTYVNPRVSSYRHSPIDPWGNKTETWYALRTVNNTVHCLASTLNRIDSTAVYHFQPGTPLECENPPQEGSLVLAAATPDDRLAVGEFRDRINGDRYVMLLNKNLTKTLNANGLKWRDDVNKENLEVVSPYLPGERSAFRGENAWIAPGQALLIYVP